MFSEKRPVGKKRLHLFHESYVSLLHSLYEAVEIAKGEVEHTHTQTHKHAFMWGYTDTSEKEKTIEHKV